MAEFTGMVAIVTGSSSGIGERIAQRLSELGASVVVNSASSVEAGQQVTIEKLPNETGSQVVFDQVLLLSADGSVRVGQPVVAGATVTGTVLEQTKDNKILVHKYRRRKNSRKTIGHRQPITRVRIQAIQG